jgi:hypothetical protein
MRPMRYAHWTRDELTLALALYRRIGGKPDETHDEVIDLSRVLRSRASAADAAFRSPEAVSMKLRGFMQFAADTAAKGLVNAGSLAGEVWSAFADADKLAAEVSRILASAPATAATLAPAAPVTESVEPVQGLRVACFTRGAGRVAYARAGFPAVVVVFGDERVKVTRDQFVRDEFGVVYVLAN